ncbi:MAG: RNA polymerase subunit sigma-70 [Hyphomicrobium sp. 32-62-53]|nr:MAG: RNA polymerase subunit sigma-70 [Hyphomicrobium sp. 12-62-95]OYY00524.1 MAG: RNA polymerase subunit sigma-70 [Hyphomicrobium sp. 32-62-53]
MGPWCRRATHGISGQPPRSHGEAPRRGHSVTEDVRARMIEFLPRLRRFAFALTRNMDQADDLVQDTCERALSRLDQWEPGTKLESWMYRIAQNLWLDRKRSEKVRGPALDIDEAVGVVGEDGRAVTESRLTLAAVSEGMDRLPPDQQVLVAMVCVDGLSYKDAAAILNVPIGTVMSRLSRARQALYQHIAADAGVSTAQIQERLHGSRS